MNKQQTLKPKAGHLNLPEIHNCRLCKKNGLKEIIDFGMMDIPKWPKTKDGGVKAPLKLMVCDFCGMGQLAHTFDPEDFFRDYWYGTGMNGTRRTYKAN